jgi:hypothetical protein
MEAPVCRICGKKHWARVCADVTSVTPGVTSPVTPIVTVPRSVAPSKLAAAEKEIERLTGEVAYLKMLLAGKPGATPPMTGAERVRRLRERRKSR